MSNANMSNELKSLLDISDDVEVAAPIDNSTTTLDKSLLKEDLKQLLVQYEEAEAINENAEAILKDCKQKQSALVEQIAKVYGKLAPGKKMISYKGQTLSIVCRPHKHGETWFLRGKSNKNDAFEII